MQVQVTLNSLEEAIDLFAFLDAKKRTAAPMSVPNVPPQAQSFTAAVETVPSGRPVPPVNPQPEVIPTQAPSYTLDQLSRAATALMDAGKQAELYALVNSFGVPALTMLPKERYGEYATGLRQLGAKI